VIADIARKVRRLLAYTRNSRGELLAGVLFTSLKDLAAIWMIANLLGSCVAAVEQGDTSALLSAVLFALPWLAGLIALNTAARYLFGIVTARAAAAMRSSLLDVLLNTSLRKSLSTHSGVKLSYFTNDISAAFDSLITTLTAPVSSIIVGVVCMVYVITVHWAIAAIAVAIGLLTFLYSVFFAKWLHGIARKMQALMAVLESRMKDILDGMVVSRVYGMREKLEKGMGGASDDLCREGIRWARVSGVLGAVNNAVSHLSERGLIFAAGLFLLSGALSLPLLMRAAEMAGGIIGVFYVSRMLIGVQRSLAGAQRVFDVMDGAEAEPSGTAAAAGKDANPVLRFSRVTFGYNPAQPVLVDVSFSAARGEMIALTGPSGGGKSTVLRLAQGLYLPDSGGVMFMGVAVREWDAARLRGLLSLVPQEPVLFPGTIAANIAIGDRNPDKGRVEEAAARAFARDFIMSMPRGYDTLVGERGASLSGGQRQRVAIARALYRDAPALLLDEATSAMDSESEAAVHNTITALKGKKTILYVTHRQAAMRLADKVIVI
jgi:ABC-type multidrug transport system fused ATPase/permease subunit